jgi:hypothetical protein
VSGRPASPMRPTAREPWSKLYHGGRR